MLKKKIDVYIKPLISFSYQLKIIFCYPPFLFSCFPLFSLEKKRKKTLLFQSMDEIMNGWDLIFPLPTNNFLLHYTRGGKLGLPIIGHYTTSL